MGVLVALFALMATASAQTEDTQDPAKPTPAKKAAPAKKKPAAPKKKAPEPPPEEPAVEAEHEPTPEEIEASLPPHINGPKLVDLGNNIEIDLPAGLVLFEHAEAKAILEQGGNSAENVAAIIIKIGGDWMVSVDYDDVGYVTDKDADQLDAQELFNQYSEGNRQQNERRKAMGIAELFLDGWSEMPKYHNADHHLMWGLKGHSVDGPVINFFTRVLGRNGYMSIDLVDSPDRIEASKVETAPLFAATRFKTGFRYEDHAEGDKSSGMGLRALVLGGTGLAVMKVAKAGILIKILLVFKKLWIVLIVGIGGFFKWLFGRKKDEESYEPASDDSGTPPPADPSAT